MDHAAGMPVDLRVFEAMKPYFLEKYGNPSSAHSFGATAQNALLESRTNVAQLVGAEKPDEVIFTWHSRGLPTETRRKETT
jgi:cysteine desulfurase